eukprot:1316808-Rhodomonas_salina.2
MPVSAPAVPPPARADLGLRMRGDRAPPHAAAALRPLTLPVRATGSGGRRMEEGGRKENAMRQTACNRLLTHRSTM